MEIKATRAFGTAAVLTLCAVAWSAQLASATFPGRNGLIAATRYADIRGCGSYRAIFTFRFDGRRVRKMRQLTCELSQAHDRPQWTPDGRHILYHDIDDPTGGVGPPDTQELRLMDADGSHNRRVGATGANDFAWAPNGRVLAWDGVYIGPLSNPERRFLVGGLHPSWSPDGHSIALVESQRERCHNVSIFDAQTGARVRVLARAIGESGECFGGGFRPDWSPDGRKIVYDGFGNRSAESTDNIEIYTIRTDGTHRRRLTHNTIEDGGAVWSPNGRWITYSADSALSFMHPDGSGKRTFRIGVISPSWQTLPR